jgi:AraC-like DNA-binding protein
MTAPAVRSFASGAVRHLLEGFAAMGLDGTGLCREAGLAPRRLGERGGRVDVSLLCALFAAAEARSGDPLVGLHAAERAGLGGLASYVIGSQSTVARALEMQLRYQVLLLGADAVTVRSHGGMRFVALEMDPPPEAHRHLTEYCIASSCRLLGWLTLQAGRAGEIHFRHAAAGATAEYERVFGCTVRFAQLDNGALLSDATLGERLVSANQELAAQLDRLAHAELGRYASTAFRDGVALALRAAPLDGTRVRREAVARRLGVSPRTLQRRLASERTSFAKVLDETRRQVALALVADPLISISDISRRVGYADQFAFNKAFRRWTGCSPSAYRQQASS